MLEYKGEPYNAISPPQPDNDITCELGQRVVLKHELYGSGLCTAKLYIVQKGILHAGWVIGYIK